MGNILINGTRLHCKQSAKYFRLLTKYKHHTVIPDNYIYTYPFCLYPEKSAPSGSMNFSRIDDTRLSLYSEYTKDIM